jgi:hypothetical protein
MRTLKLVNGATVVFTAMVMTAIIILTPSADWDFTLAGALVSLALAMLYAAYGLSSLIFRMRSADTGYLAVIGPLALIAGTAIVTAIASFVLAMLEWNKLSWVMTVLVGGIMTAGWLTAQAAAAAVDGSQSPRSSHAAWRDKARGLATLATDCQSKIALGHLAENFRYAARERLNKLSSNSHLGV